MAGAAGATALVLVVVVALVVALLFCMVWYNTRGVPWLGRLGYAWLGVAWLGKVPILGTFSDNYGHCMV